VNNDAKFVVQSDRAGFNGVSYSGFVNGETSSVLGGAATITRSNASTNTASSYVGVLTATGLTSDNYTLTYRPGNFTIVASNQLLVEVTNASATYGTAAQYAISSAKYENNGTVYTLGSGGVAGSSVSINSSNVVSINDGAGGLASFTVAPIAGVLSHANQLAAGSYQLGASGTVTANSANFSNTLTIIGAHQVNTKGITASASNVSKVYDGTTSMSGVTLALSALETNDIVTVNGNGSFADKNVGTNRNYTVSGLMLSGADAGNYYLTGGTSFSGSNGVITTAPLTVTASNANKTYDGLAYSGGNGVSYSGLVGGESASVLGGTLSYGGTSQAAINAGSYTITPSGLSSSNYAISYVDGTLSVAKANATVTGNSSTLPYSGVNQTVSGFTATGLVNGETEAVLTGVSASRTEKNAGTYTVTPSGTATNYNLTFVDGAMVINPATISVTTINGALQGSVNKVYDGTNVATLASVNYALTGWLGSDGATVTKTNGTYDNANAGSGKTVTVSLLTADYSATGSTNLGNYNLPTSISGAIGNINKSPLIITANNANKTYDGLAYSGGNGVSYSGLVGGESASVLGGTLSYGGTSQAAINAGSYTITPSGLSSSNYAISYVDGTLSVAKANATVTGNSSTLPYSGVNQTVSGFTATGLVNGETTSVLTSVSASRTEKNAGTYAVTPNGTASNYNLTLSLIHI
jgi:hypothetical protein